MAKQNDPRKQTTRADKVRVADAKAHHNLGRRGENIIKGRGWQSDPNAFQANRPSAGGPSTAPNQNKQPSGCAKIIGGAVILLGAIGYLIGDRLLG